MRLVKIAAAVVNQTPLDWEGNTARILNAIDEARRDDVGLLCFPELCITGYGCEDAFHAPGVLKSAWEMLERIAGRTSGLAVSVGLPVLFRGGVFDVAALLVDGQLIGLAAKQNLAGDGIHYEPRWFKPWPAGHQADYHHGSNTYPLGDLVFECGDIRIGFEICEDAWVAERPGGDLAGRGVDIILNPSASHFAFGKHRVRRRFVLEGARAFHVSYVYSNLLGNEAGRAIYDGDAVIASNGKILAEAKRFSYADFHLTSAVVDVEQTRMAHARAESSQVELEDGAGHFARTDFTLGKADPTAHETHVPDWESTDRVKEEEFTRAVSLGLFDYLRKSRSCGFVVSLSGGADSAAVACLAALMVRLGLAELGADRFAERLSHLKTPLVGPDATSMTGRLLTCVYQSTRNSSDVTRDAAQAVAESLGATFHVLDVDNIVQEYEAIVCHALGRPLTWEHDDIALQNIQARVRSPSVWMLANVLGALLLSTSNRSEAAVGYATMDGDTSGGLAPIAGIDKAFLRSWLVWLEKAGPTGVGPVPALGRVNVQLPTAELRPPKAGQTDESDLMPYVVLDAIERAAIRDKLMPIETLQRLMLDGTSGYEVRQLAEWIARFYRLWARNQWKRERYAPSFHVDDENLDPKTWCRFPILSGGFERELKQLSHYVAQTES